MTTKLKTSQILHGILDLATVLDSKLAVIHSGSFTYDPPAISAGFSSSQAFSVPGALAGDYCLVSFSQNLAGVVVTAYVDSSNSVTVTFFNATASTINLASGNLKLALIRA